jgi:long-subunit fatty acid transport protein
MKIISVFLCLSLFCFKSHAQKSAENKLGAWYMFNGSHKLSEKYSLQTMAHFRYFELASEFQQEIYRLGVNYVINKKTNFTLGASYSTGDLAYDLPSLHLYEWRLYEDLNVISKWTKFKARHRFRLEHRFIHRDLTDETRNWFRYDLNVNYPLSEKWSMYAFNEIFLNFKGAIFAQNWTGFGFLRKINENLKFKMGYFQIKQNTRTLKRIRIGVLLNTDFF